MSYPPFYHTRLRAEALGQYKTYTEWAAQSSSWARKLRDEGGDPGEAAVFQRISALEYANARRYRNIYINQGPLADREKESRDGVA